MNDRKWPEGIAWLVKETSFVTFGQNGERLQLCWHTVIFQPTAWKWQISSLSECSSLFNVFLSRKCSWGECLLDDLPELMNSFTKTPHDIARALEEDILKSCLLSGASFAIITFHKKKRPLLDLIEIQNKNIILSFDIEDLEFSLFSVTGI